MNQNRRLEDRPKMHVTNNPKRPAALITLSRDGRDVFYDPGHDSFEEPSDEIRAIAKQRGITWVHWTEGVERLALLRNFILVKPLKELKIGSFWIPRQDEKAFLGQIIKLGKGYRTGKKTANPNEFEALSLEYKPWSDLGIEVGQIIQYGNFYSKKSETRIDGTDYIIMTDQDIACIIDEPDLVALGLA